MVIITLTHLHLKKSSAEACTKELLASQKRLDGLATRPGDVYIIIMIIIISSSSSIIVLSLLLLLVVVVVV